MMSAYQIRVTRPQGRWSSDLSGVKGSSFFIISMSVGVSRNALRLTFPRAVRRGSAVKEYRIHSKLPKNYDTPYSTYHHHHHIRTMDYTTYIHAHYIPTHSPHLDDGLHSIYTTHPSGRWTTHQYLLTIYQDDGLCDRSLVAELALQELLGDM